MGYRIRLVWSAEPRFVDSVAMIASQMADGSHTLKIRLVDEVNGQFAFYRFFVIATGVPARMRDQLRHRE